MIGAHPPRIVIAASNPKTGALRRSPPSVDPLRAICSRSSSKLKGDLPPDMNPSLRGGETCGL